MSWIILAYIRDYELIHISKDESLALSSCLIPAFMNFEKLLNAEALEWGSDQPTPLHFKRTETSDKNLRQHKKIYKRSVWK